MALIVGLVFPARSADTPAMRSRLVRSAVTPVLGLLSHVVFMRWAGTHFLRWQASTAATR